MRTWKVNFRPAESRFRLRGNLEWFPQTTVQTVRSVRDMKSILKAGSIGLKFAVSEFWNFLKKELPFFTDQSQLLFLLRPTGRRRKDKNIFKYCGDIYSGNRVSGRLSIWTKMTNLWSKTSSLVRWRGKVVRKTTEFCVATRGRDN